MTTEQSILKIRLDEIKTLWIQKKPCKKNHKVEEGELFLGVIALGFEPRTVCLEGRCSIQLSYATVVGRGGRIRTCDLLLPKQAR